MERKSVYALFLIILFISGCVSQTKVATDNPTDAATIELAEAATHVSQSLNELAAIEQANLPPHTYKSLVNASRYIAGNVSVDWSGPVEPLLKRLAELSGYRTRVVGVRPAIPIIVTLAAKDVPLADVVRDVDFQSDRKAKVLIYPNARVIELRYIRSV